MGFRRSAVMMLIVAIVGTVLATAATAASSADDAPSTTAAVDPAVRIQRQLTELDDGVSVSEVSPPPRVTAKSWLAYDPAAGEPIATLDPGTARPIASLTKLMTALLVVERTQLDELVTIPAAVEDLPPDAARMDARVGEKWPVSDLLRAMLVHSANDAAIALATHVSGSEAVFVKLMNERAAELGLARTELASATGLDAPGEASTSTPVDLVALALEALEQEPIRSAVAEESITLERPGGGTPITLANRNPLLGSYDGVDGIKTGFTDPAGYMLAIHHLDDATQGELVIATFASSSEKTRISDMRALLDWSRTLRSNVLAVEGGTPIGTVPVQRSNEHVQVFACDDLLVSARVGQRLTHEVVLPRSIAAPIATGDEIGELRVRVGEPAKDGSSKLPATVALCSADTIPVRSRTERLLDYARDYRSAWQSGIDEVRDTATSIQEAAA